MEVYYYQSPIGRLKLVEDGDFLREINFAEENGEGGSDHPVLRETVRQLSEYFEGKRTDFDLPVKPYGTGFQQKVWNMLSDIPFGATITYMDLAKKLGNDRVVRAAGRANAKNPIPIVIPCHRVIGSNGRLTGYSGGIDRKRWLLKHEGSILL